MERVETLLKKLQEQFAQKADAGKLLLTIRMLEAELQQIQALDPGETPKNNVALTFSGQYQPQPVAPNGKHEPENVPEEKIVEMLQVDEAEIEAELEEIKRNAEAKQKMGYLNKPAIHFEPDESPEEDIPTLAHQAKTEMKKDINETVASTGTSIHEKLRQSKIDLGDEPVEAPIRDLRKAIGVNDRYMFINELFRGDEVSYERSIKTINSFSILPEAEYWIQRELKIKNGWKDSDEAVKHFDQLVKRRFS